MTGQLSSFFASPVGLAALAALVPLLLFYLIKPEPEEQVMPSMMFFMERKESGKVSQAFNRLVSNLVLLLQVLFVAGTAAAIAGPLVQGFERPESTVMVLDRSASMEDDMSEAKNYLKSRIGDQNTLIVADSSSRVVVERATPGEFRSAVNSIESADTGTDIASALQRASEYDGEVVVASDLDQSVSSRDIKPLLDSIDATRKLEIFEASNSNRHGIVNVEPSGNNVTLEVKNLEDNMRTLEVAHQEGRSSVEVPGREVESLDLPASPGLKEFSLPEDENPADDTAYVSVPETGSFEVMYLGGSDNPYVRKASELISFTDYRYEEAPYDGQMDADIYFVGESSRVLESNIRSIESQVRSRGKAMVIMQQDTSRFKASPAELGERQNATVEVLDPVRTTFETEILDSSSINGTSLSSPREALVKQTYGEGEVLLYNVEDDGFRFDFVYPIFWKQLFGDFADRPSVESLNLETSQELDEGTLETPGGETRSGEFRATEAGFYTGEEGEFAANLESVDESTEEKIEYEASGDSSDRERANVQHLASLLLLLLVLGELAYLQWTGEI